jgi:hypothetical protein
MSIIKRSIIAIILLTLLFSTLVYAQAYKPVLDTRSYIEDGGELNDNFQYKEWCEETFDNGKHIYEAYKNIAFNIKYTTEPNNTDFLLTPLEIARLKRSEGEDVVFHFFSQLPPNQKNAEIVWGWVIDKQSAVGRAHVWYQLTDKKGQKYVVEGFSKDWNGIIPMDIIQDAETRKPIFTISHSYDDAQSLFIDRCTNCHSVFKILNEDKTKEEWEETILRMRDEYPELFLEEDISILTDCLTEGRKAMREDVAARTIVNKCLVCHEWGGILKERKSRRDWENCVNDMRKFTRQTLKKDWFTHNEFKIVVDLLVKTQGLVREEGVRIN